MVSAAPVNKIIFYIKRQEFIFFSSDFDQSVFDKNYNRILQSLNSVEGVKCVTAAHLLGYNLHLELLCEDGLILNHIIELVKC